MKDIKARSVTLMLTNSCNLNCTYCYEHSKTNNKMDVSLAKEIVQREIDEMDGYNTLVIEFLGGEPFLEFESMKALVEFIYTIDTEKNIYCFTTTNGTLVHGKIQRWLEDNRDRIKCGLSLDGTEWMHNINRNSSYRKIDVEFFRKNWPEQSVKMTISLETLPELANGIIHLHELGFRVDCNLAYGLDWNSIEYREVLKKQLSILIDYYIEHPEIKPCSMLDVSLNKVKAKYNEEYRVKLCGTGTRMKVYETDGKIYPCQYFIPSTMGNEIKFDSSILSDRIPLKNLDEKCIDCPIYNICPNCYGANILERGYAFSNSVINCNIGIITAKATAYLKYKMYIMNLLPPMEHDEEFRLLRGIKLVQDLDFY